jgi:hypothetical protein
MLRRLSILLAAAGALTAQQVVTPTTEPVGSPRGTNTGNYNITESFELGYRHKAVGGDEGMYRSVVDYGNGLRLFSSSLSVNSRDGHGHYFDEIELNTLGLGNDNYQSAVLRVQKNGLYRYDMNWRLDAYYSPGLTVAGGAHLEDTIRRLQDHEFTLFPRSHFRLHLGYSRNTEDGPALTTAQEFDLNGSGFPVFMNVKRNWNEYRLGGEADVAGFRLRIQRRWDFFKDDTPLSPAGAVGAPGADQTVVQQFQRSQPIHGANPGWLGYLFTRRKLWGANARLTYVSGHNDFALNELASGIGQFGAAANRQIAVIGNAHRPDLAGDLNLNFFPTDKLTIVNDTSITSNRIDGASTYSEINTGTDLGQTINFRFLGVRLVTTSTDVNYRASKWIGFFAGYHYSDRLVRTVEGFTLPAFANSTENDRYEVSNHLNSGTLGLRLRPVKPFSINLSGEIGRANNPLTPISEKNYHAIDGRADYRTRQLQLSTAYHQVYNINGSGPLSFVSFSSHSRQYSANASWAPKDRFSIDASYNRLHLNTLSGLAFFAGTGLRPQLQTTYSSLYESNIHAGTLAAHIAILKRADLFVGYSIVKDTGLSHPAATTTDPAQTLLNAVQAFPLTYQSPMARLSVRITPKVRWNAGWQYYGYTEDAHFFNVDQNFRANVAFTSVLWSF